MLLPNTSCITNFKLLASVAAEISRGGGSQNLVVPNVEEPHIYRSEGKKVSSTLLSLISVPVNDVIKRH